MIYIAYCGFRLLEEMKLTWMKQLHVLIKRRPIRDCIKWRTKMRNNWFIFSLRLYWECYLAPTAAVLKCFIYYYHFCNLVMAVFHQNSLSPTWSAFACQMLQTHNYIQIERNYLGCITLDAYVAYIVSLALMHQHMICRLDSISKLLEINTCLIEQVNHHHYV